MSIINIIEAKFKRENTLNLQYTILVKDAIKRHVWKDIADKFSFANHETPILLYWYNNNGYIITTEKIHYLQKNSKAVILITDILTVDLIEQYSLEDKSKGFERIYLKLKDSSIIHINIELGSFNIIYGIIAFLVR